MACTTYSIRGSIWNMADKTPKRSRYVRQTDIPSVPLTEALRVVSAIADNYAKEATKPLDVAVVLNLSPTSGTFRTLCGAAIGYGVTAGGPNAAQIELTPLGTRVASPLEEGDGLEALREAVLQPTIVRGFLQKYDGSPIPTDKIAFNVLETLGVPVDATQRALNIIVENATHVGMLKKIKDKTYVDLLGTVADTPAKDALTTGDHTQDDEDQPDEAASFDRSKKQPLTPFGSNLSSNRKVYISHGSNRRIVDQLKELLQFGDFEAVVSVEKETAAKPVPDKVMDDMRACSAGILHVSAEEELIDSKGKERLVLNSNVLIEIGAAMALYRGRFILLVEDGTNLPSNLQGLYKVRYSGDELGYDATMKVLKSLNEFKKPPADDS